MKCHYVAWPYTMTILYRLDFLQNCDLINKINHFPNYVMLPWNICDGRGMLTGDAYSSVHQAPSHLGICIWSTGWDQSYSWTWSYFSGLYPSNISRHFNDFAANQYYWKRVPLAVQFCKLTEVNLPFISDTNRSYRRTAIPLATLWRTMALYWSSSGDLVAGSMSLLMTGYHFRITMGPVSCHSVTRKTSYGWRSLKRHG